MSSGWYGWFETGVVVVVAVEGDPHVHDGPRGERCASPRTVAVATSGGALAIGARHGERRPAW
ncbi:hypothetical protein [Streptomyces sp. NPDC088141]|uniref:hypothetical protein n=1 Tax=Streptomyces sp. NPDC088141 TaxID=3155179 RepID=UPI00343097B9